MRLYRLPLLYSALRSPDVALFRLVLDLVEAHLHGPRESVLDPACGPGDWLSLFGCQGWRLGGNDNSLPMVRAAKTNLGAFRAELSHDDMRRFTLSTRPFDLATELSCVVAELPDQDAFVAHLERVAAHLRPGGLYILLLPHRVGEIPVPLSLHHDGPTPVPSGGTASIRYEAIQYDRSAEIVWIRRNIEVATPEGRVRRVTDRYALQAGWIHRLPEVLQLVPSFEVVAVVEGPESGDSAELDERVVVLRRR